MYFFFKSQIKLFLIVAAKCPDLFPHPQFYPILTHRWKMFSPSPPLPPFPPSALHYLAIGGGGLGGRSSAKLFHPKNAGGAQRKICAREVLVNENGSTTLAMNYSILERYLRSSSALETALEGLGAHWLLN